MPKTKSKPRTGRGLLRVDPTRTGALRKKLVREMKRRFRKLRMAVMDLVDREDAFGLRANAEAAKRAANAFCPTGEGGGVDPTCSPQGAGSAAAVKGAFGVDKRVEFATDDSGKVYGEHSANVFCPTGPGGGVDPTCSLSGSGGGIGKEAALQGLLKLGRGDAWQDRDPTGLLKAKVKESDKAKIVEATKAVKDAQPNPFIKPTVAQVAERSGLSAKTVHAGLAQLQREGKVTLGPYTQALLTAPRPEYLIPLDREFKFYVTVNAFCPTGEGGGVDPSCSPGQGGGGGAPGGGALAKLGAAGKWLVNKVKGAFTKLETRYGRKAAIGILAASVVTFPIPFNITAIVGAAEAAKWAKGKLTGNEGEAEFAEELRELWEEMLRLHPEAQKVVNSFYPTGEGGGVGPSCSPHPGSSHGGGVSVKPSKERAFDGATPVKLKTELTKQETGRVGEAVVLAWLKLEGYADARAMNSAQTNFPIDLIEDHAPTEVKTGLVSNGRKAQQWRLTFSKESKTEKEAYEKMSEEDRESWNSQKQARIKERKEAVIKELGKKYGKEIKPRTITVALNPDTKTADIYVFDGFHDRIDWQSDAAKKAYKGSVKYGPGDAKHAGGRVRGAARNVHGGMEGSAGGEDGGRRNGRVINAAQWRFASDAEKVKAFQEWLKTQLQAQLLGKTEEELWRRYTEEGFKRGAGRAFDDVKGKLPKGGQTLDFYRGTREQFLRSAFARPVAVEKVKLLAGRSFDDLKGVTDAMSTAMSRTLTDGLVRGISPRDIAKDLADDVDGIGETRALVIARTEIVRAHAEGQLDAMEDLGVEEVGVMVEWRTAGDEHVCDECAPLEGVVLTIEEARGMLPRHPNCVLPGNFAQGRITGALKAWYAGKAVELLAANGARVSLTVNHPVLAEHGFVGAGKVKKGDYLVCHFGQSETAREANIEHGPTLIEDVFKSFPASHETIFGFDLNGDEDFIVGEVDVVSSDLPLGKNMPLDRERIGEVFFVPAGDGCVRRADLLDPLFFRHAFPLEQLCLAARSESNAGVLQPSVNDPGADADGVGYRFGGLSTDVSALDALCVDAQPMPYERCFGHAAELNAPLAEPVRQGITFATDLASKLVQRFPSKVALDKVVDVRHFWYSGPVYDLETTLGYFTVSTGGMESIIIKNCRCAWLPANVGEKREDQQRSKGEIGEAVRASRRAEERGEGEEGGEWGPGAEIARARPEALVNFERTLRNAFCPTGEGGGVDPSCSPFRPSARWMEDAGG